MASLKNTTIVPSHFHQWDVCEINVQQSILAWSECVSGMFHEPELLSCNTSEECQFTFLECHFITFISTLLSPCQTSQGSVQFKCPLLHTQVAQVQMPIFLFVCLFCLSCVCQIIIVIGLLRISACALQQESKPIKYVRFEKNKKKKKKAGEQNST